MYATNKSMKNIIQNLKLYIFSYFAVFGIRIGDLNNKNPFKLGDLRF